MDVRLCNEKSARRFQKTRHLLKELFLVLYLVNHPEGQNKVNLARDPQLLSARKMGLKPVRKALTSHTADEGVEHPLLNIDRDHSAFVTDKLAQDRP